MPSPDPDIRLSTSERETILGRLHSAVEEGRLDLDEFAERSRLVYEAKTHADVDRLLSDLPAEGGTVAVPGRRAPAAPAPDLNLDLTHGRIRRRGDWTVPAKITAKLLHSAAVLDARDAAFTADEVDVSVDLVHSRLTIVLPRGASAVADDVQLIGGTVVNRCDRAGDGPRFRLSGRTRWGRVTIRYERRFLLWRW